MLKCLHNVIDTIGRYNINNLKHRDHLAMFEPWQGIEISKENKLL